MGDAIVRTLCADGRDAPSPSPMGHGRAAAERPRAQPVGFRIAAWAAACSSRRPGWPSPGTGVTRHGRSPWLSACSGSSRRQLRGGSALRPPLPAGCRLRRTKHATLRQIARRTWRFFEATVTPADHMLPPDNFQEDPNPVLARRTSPDEYRHVPTVGRQRPRLRLDRNL